MCKRMMDWKVREKNGGVRYIKLPCGGCWECRKARVNDLVGRCLCEKAVSDWSVCVNLTYANSPEREEDGAHRLLNKRHAQLWLKLLRASGLSVRYLIVGEYGKRRGRAHFHAILFGMGERPAWPQGMSHDDRWPHGHIEVNWEVAERAMRYAVKYMSKGRSLQIWKSQSKVPALGVPYIRRIAERDAVQGILPPDFRYYPPGATGRDSYYLTGAARREYLDTWVNVSGRPALDVALRHSEFVQSSLEQLDSWRARKSLTAADGADMLERVSNDIERRHRIAPNYEYLDEWLEREQYATERGGASHGKE